MNYEKSQCEPFSLEQVAAAIALVKSYGHDAKVSRFDEVYQRQPNVLGAATQLGSLDIPMPLIDHALHILLVLYECFTANIPNFPKIEQHTVQAEFDRNVSMLNFFDGETESEAIRLQRHMFLKHREQPILAFVVSYLQEHCWKENREQELVRNCCVAMTNSFINTKWKCQ